MLKDDWLMRTVHRLVELLARATTAAREGRLDEAKKQLDEAYSGQLGMPRRMLERLDPATCVMTLGREKSKLLVMLLEAEAEIDALCSNEGLAAVRRGRAADVKSLIEPG